MDCEKVELDEAEDSGKAKEGAATADADTDIVKQIVSQATAIGKFVNLPFEDNEERICSVIRVLVEKAINEPSFASTHARLICEICQNSSRDTWYNIFRVKLMDQFRKEFQKSSNDKTEIKEIEIAIKETNDESKKEEEIEGKRAHMRRRSLGNVNFIGELYSLRTKKLRLLTLSFMIKVIEMLLSLDELNLECLCKLLTSVGFKLEKKLRRKLFSNAKDKKKKGDEIKLDPEPKWFDEIFKKLDEWSKEESLSAHVRFALLDVLKLHKNWKSRREGSWRSTKASSQPPSKQPQKIVKIGDFEKVELHKYKAENPWKPRRGAVDTNIKEQIARQTTGILNKVTPDNFDRLVKEFLSFPLEDKEERISSVHTICQNSQETSKIFRKKILDHCQKEFQKTSIDEIDINEIEIAIEKSDNVSKKESLKKEFEEKRTQMRRRSLGNVRFIGELYKLQMLTPRIMIDSVTMLLSMDEESLECLCKLLTTVGFTLEEQIKDIETSNEVKRNRGQEIKFAPEPKWFDKTFNKLYNLSKEESLSSRIRFALLDVFELRQNNWKPGHHANALKTIDQVRRDAIIRGGDIKNPLGWNTVPSNKSSRFRQKQSGDHNSGFGFGSQSPFLSPSTSWRSRPSPIPQLQMLSQSLIEKLPPQPNLPLSARCGSNFEVFSDEKKALPTTPTRAEIVKSLPIPQSNKNAQQQNESSNQKPIQIPIPQFQMLSQSQSPIEKLPSIKPTLPSRCGSNFEAFLDENKALPTTPTTRVEIEKSLPQSNKNSEQNVSSIQKPSP